MTNELCTLRQHPDTGRLAERIPQLADTELPWFSYTWTSEGLSVTLLSDEDAAGWAPVKVVPA